MTYEPIDVDLRRGKEALNSSQYNSLYQTVKSIVGKVAVGLLATCVFCTSFAFGAFMTFVNQTIPETKFYLQSLWADLWRYRSQMFEDALDLLSDWLFPVRWLRGGVRYFSGMVEYWWLAAWSVAYGFLELQPVKDLIRRLKAAYAQVEWKHGIVEFLYSFVALGIVCNLVLLRFSVVSVYNLRKFFFTSSGAKYQSSQSSEELFVNDEFQDRTRNPVSSSDHIDRMSEYSEKYTTWSKSTHVKRTPSTRSMELGNNATSSPATVINSGRISPGRRRSSQENHTKESTEDVVDNSTTPTQQRRTESTPQNQRASKSKRPSVFEVFDEGQK